METEKIHFSWSMEMWYNNLNPKGGGDAYAQHDGLWPAAGEPGRTGNDGGNQNGESQVS